MSTVVEFAGKNRIEPGVYAETLGQVQNAPDTASFGRVLVIDTGSAAGFGAGCGVNGARLKGIKSMSSFNSDKDMKAFMVGGIWYDLANYLFKPEKNVKGADVVDFISAKTSTPASITLNFANGYIVLKTKAEGVIANASRTPTNGLLNGYECIMAQGIKDTTKFYFKFYQGVYTGVDADGDPFDGITSANSVPKFIIASPEVNTIAALVAWIKTDRTLNGFFYYGSSYITGNGTIQSADLNTSPTTALIARVGTELVTPPLGVSGTNTLSIAQSIAAYVTANSTDLTAVASDLGGGHSRVAFTGKVGTGSTLNSSVVSVGWNGYAADIPVANLTNMSGGVDLVEHVNVVGTDAFKSITFVGGTFVSSYSGAQIVVGLLVYNPSGTMHINITPTNYTADSAPALATALKNGVNSMTGTTGYTATDNGAGVLTVTAPLGSGAARNGWTVRVFAYFADTTNDVPLIYSGSNPFAFAGGVNQTYTIDTPETLATGKLEITSVNLANTNYSVGATETYNASDLDDLLTAIIDHEYNFILCDKYGDGAQGTENTKIFVHITGESAFGREMFVGGGYDALKRDQSNGSIPIAQYYNSKRVNVVHSGIEKNVFSGATKKLLSSLYHAAIVCGRIAGLQPQVPGTWKSLNIDGIVDDMDLSEREFMLQNGVLHTRFVNNLGFVINQSINSLQNNTELVYENGDSPEISIVRIADQLNTELIINGRRKFVGTNINTTAPIDVKNFIEGYLSFRTAQKSADDLIISFRNVKVVYNNGDYFITYEYQPNGPVNKFFVTSFMLNLSFNA